MATGRPSSLTLDTKENTTTDNKPTIQVASRLMVVLILVKLDILYDPVDNLKMIT